MSEILAGSLQFCFLQHDIIIIPDSGRFKSQFLHAAAPPCPAYSWQKKLWPQSLPTGFSRCISSPSSKPGILCISARCLISSQTQPRSRSGRLSPARDPRWHTRVDSASRSVCDHLQLLSILAGNQSRARPSPAASLLSSGQDSDKHRRAW